MSTFIRAFAQVSTQCSQSCWQHQLHRRLRARAQEAGTGGSTGRDAGVHLRRRTQRLFANARVFVQPSLLEGLPLTVLEAISHGVPVVLSDIPGHLEILPVSRPGGRLSRQVTSALSVMPWPTP